MMTNSQVGSYTYPTSSIRPHAVQTAGGNTYSYDDNGNMTNGAGRQITYDYDNRPVSITSGGATSTFLYDGGGSRVRKTSNSVSTIYIGKLYENTPDGCVKYIFAGEQRIAMRDAAGALYYYHTDHLGSSSVVTDAAGNMVENIAYFPYGETRINTGTQDVHHKFTGQELDAETGLYFYGARYYDPQLGRFISADTIVPDHRNPQDLNRYSYVSNNPLNYIDPTGHSWFSKFLHDIDDTTSEWGEEIKQFLDKNDINVNAGAGGTIDSGGYAEPIGYNPETGETFPYMPSSAANVTTVSIGIDVCASGGCDGYLDPATLTEAGGPPSPFGIPVDLQLLPSGEGYYSYAPSEKQYANPMTINVIKEAGVQWYKSRSSIPFGIGDISRQGGGSFLPHQGHRLGIEFDIRPLRVDGSPMPVSINSSSYSRALTQELVNVFRSDPRVGPIYFNDPGIVGVTPYPGHDNHLHIRTNLP